MTWWLWISENSAAVQGIAAVVQVLVALLIAGITLWYARLTRGLMRATENQVRLSENLLTATQQQVELQTKAARIALYERHLKLYKAVRWFLNEFHPHMRLDMPNLFKLRRLTVESSFLLQSSALQFIRDVDKNALAHWSTEHKLESWSLHKERGDPVEDHQKLMDEKHELEKWLTSDAFILTDEHFKPYLGFTVSELEQP